ncbi:hypothetical protein [Azohydromonas australica]|uniref:hypothetical protein n=1 Tax=Azohydromonas australica TaxID=364039 RepID=UPI0012ECA4ED|nr:hypothetical protein [Azohydromonas australica]
MRCMDGRAWEEGFHAGQHLGKSCPYQSDSQEEWDWHAAWLEGAAKKLGMRYSRTAAERDARHFSRSLADESASVSPSVTKRPRLKVPARHGAESMKPHTGCYRSAWFPKT